MSSESRPWYRDPENVIRLVTVVGGLVAFVLGLREYREDQRWKRLALFTEQLQAFEAEPAIGGALTMLDYRDPTICVAEEWVPDPARRCFQATDSLMTAALSSVLERRVLSDHEYQVVYALDRLLTALDRIEYFHAQGFLGPEVQHPTVAYWISLIGDGRSTTRPPEVKHKLCAYVREMEYAGALALVTRYTPAEHRVRGCNPGSGPPPGRPVAPPPG
jgi:hypothetical protein